MIDRKCGACILRKVFDADFVSFYLIQACEKGDDDFYEVQCSTYNKEPYRGLYLEWTPNYKQYDCK